MQVRRGSLEHVLERANYFKGLLTKTTDPVYWNEEKLIEAKKALNAARVWGHGHRLETAFAMLESAMFKALY